MAGSLFQTFVTGLCVEQCSLQQAYLGGRGCRTRLDSVASLVARRQPPACYKPGTPTTIRKSKSGGWVGSSFPGCLEVHFPNRPGPQASKESPSRFRMKPSFCVATDAGVVQSAAPALVVQIFGSSGLLCRVGAPKQTGGWFHEWCANL